MHGHTNVKHVACFSWTWTWTTFSLFLTIKPTRCTNFSTLFLELNSTYFAQFLCPSSGIFFHCTHSNDIYIPLLCVQRKSPDDGHRNCAIHVEFNSKNKVEKLVHLVGFIVRKSLNVVHINP